ncbi:MAG: hypothetical protein MJ237_04805 [bacterium]|nr:hypothetical protein [bacterium]
MRIKIIQNIIDKLRSKAGPKLIYEKKKALEQIENSDTLVLGCSHMQIGYIPNENEVNIATTSQDLYYSYNIYKKYCKDNIKNIVMCFSVHTPGHCLIMTKLHKICVHLKLLFDIPYQYEDVAIKKNLYETESVVRKQIQHYDKILKIPQNYRGECRRYYKRKFITKKEIIARAKGHYKNNQRENSQMEYCLKLIQETKQNNQNLVFVLPPATEIYKSVLPKSDIIFKVLYDMVKDFDHVKIINLYDDCNFTHKDFIDGDHLNNQGAMKFTTKIRSTLHQNT